MTTLAIIVPLGILSALAALVLFIVAVAQEGKSDKKGGMRQAFFTIVTMVMLMLVVGSSLALITIGLRETVLTGARAYQARSNFPPSPNGPTKILTPDVNGNVDVTATCLKDCNLSTDEKDALNTWLTSYEQWKGNSPTSLQTRRDVASGVAVFIVALPLYFVFRRWMEQGAKQELSVAGHPSAIRSLYFYVIAFGGLIIAVVGTAWLINTGLQKALKTEQPQLSQPVKIDASSTTFADQVIDCQKACGFTADQVNLAKQWKVDQETALNQSQGNAGQFQNDLTNQIPLILVGVPLFWYHFARIRKETQDKETPTPTIA